MLTQVDEYGYTLTLMEGIIDYKKDKTDLYKEDMYVVTKCVSKLPVAPWVATTAAWSVPAPVARGPTRTAEPPLLALGRYRTRTMRVME